MGGNLVGSLAQVLRLRDHEGDLVDDREGRIVRVNRKVRSTFNDFSPDGGGAVKGGFEAVGLVGLEYIGRGERRRCGAGPE